MNKKQLSINIVIALLFAVLAFVSGRDFLSMHARDQIYTKNPAITEVKKLSDYNPRLLGTAGDTEIYVMDSGVPGGKALVYGGTHPNETAAVLNAIVYIENAIPTQGTLYVIHQANQSGFTCTLPLRGQMERLRFSLPDGSERSVRIGTRLTNPVHQWPDPNYRLNSSGRMLRHDEVAETRNLNRNHPGMEQGNLTEMVCYSIRKLIDEEGIDLIYDGHEASCEFPRVNYLIAHERAMDLGSMAILNAALSGTPGCCPFQIDRSGIHSYGLSHRALGDHSAAMATLFETLNPVMGFCHDKVTEELVKKGISPNYVHLTELGLLDSGALSTKGSPVELRAGFHMEMSRNLLEAMGELNPEKTMTIEGLPSFPELIEKGLEGVLKPLNQ